MNYILRMFALKESKYLLWKKGILGYLRKIIDLIRKDNKYCVNFINN